MLVTWLPWIALAVALAVSFIGNKAPESASAPTSGRGAAHLAGALCVLFGLAAMAAGYFLRENLPGVQTAGIGAAYGAVLAALAGFLGSRLDPGGRNLAGAAGWGVAAIALAWLFPPDQRQAAQLGALAGLGAGAWILGVAATSWPSAAAIAAAAALAPSLLGSFGYGDRGPMTGVLFGVAFVTVSAMGRWLADGLPAARAAVMRPILVAAVCGATAYLIAIKLLFLRDAGAVAAIGAGSALVVHWLLPVGDDERPGPMGLGISLLIWLAAATVAFGLRHGFGIAICFCSAAIVLAGLGNARALLTTAPIAALAFFRAYKEMYPNDARSLDIGQHYGLMGLLAAATVILLAAEWRKSIAGREDGAAAAASLLWAIAILALPAIAGIVLGAKGFTGFLVGVFFAPALAALAGETRLAPAALAGGLGAASLLAFGWLTEKLDLTRDLKLQSLAGYVLALALLAAAIAWLSRPRPAPAT